MNKKEMREQMATIKGGDWPAWYDKLSDEMSGVGDDDEAFGFCSIPEYDNKADCEANGGTWTDLDVDTNLDNVDTSTLTSELALQLDELSKCFADPNLKEYLEGL